MLSIFKKETSTLNEPASNIRDLAHDGHNYFSGELIVVDEPLTGNLFCAEKVVIDQQGVLTGNITSKTCLVTGQVHGDILSLDLLEIKASAVVIGNIQSAKVHIEPGAVINGYITVGEDIEALTERWNKTKFSTDQHLSVKLNNELSAINISSAATPITVEKTETLRAAQPATSNPAPVIQSKPLIAAAAPAELKPEPAAVEKPASKPLATAAPPAQKQEEPVNQRWW